MSKPAQAPSQNRVVDLKVAAHLMTLETGLFCVFHAPGQSGATSGGLPGVRVSHAPNMPRGIVSISTFNDDGWLGAADGAALVKVTQGPAQVLVTIYQAPNSSAEGPRLQVVKLSGAPAAVQTPAVPAPAVGAPQGVHVMGGAASAAPGKPEVVAHIQRRGDVVSRIGAWMGSPGSQFWIEGFGIVPESIVPIEDIEYQAVLGKGWLSPWAEGGQYCGSRGMALPILGLRVRLKGESAEKFDVRLSASFTDGTRVGPLDGHAAIEAESLAPLEAFLIELVPQGQSQIEALPEAASKVKRGRSKSRSEPEATVDVPPAKAKDVIPDIKVGKASEGEVRKAKTTVSAPVKAAPVKASPVKEPTKASGKIKDKAAVVVPEKPAAKRGRPGLKK